jgi:hypothetical protein
MTRIHSKCGKYKEENTSSVHEIDENITGIAACGNDCKWCVGYRRISRYSEDNAPKPEKAINIIHIPSKTDHPASSRRDILMKCELCSATGRI